MWAAHFRKFQDFSKFPGLVQTVFMLVIDFQEIVKKEKKKDNGEFKIN